MSLSGNASTDNLLVGNVKGLNSIHGKSAYELAVIHGFEGTEEEWIASLKGEKGDTYTLTETDRVEIADKVATDNLQDSAENYIDSVIETKDLEVTKTATGTAITIESAKAPLQSLKLYGKTEQDGTPTPTEPKELKSVGDSGSFEVGVFGKNLLPYPFPNSNGTSYTSNGLTFTVDEEGVITINGTSTAQSTYYIARWLGTTKYDKYICAITTDGVNIVVYKGGSWYGVGNNNYLTVSAGDNLTEIYLLFGSGKTFNNAKVKVMITLEPNYDYEPYTKQTLTMPYTLRSVGDIKDEVDFNRGVLIQRLKCRVIDGHETFLTSSYANYFYTNDYSDFPYYSCEWGQAIANVGLVHYGVLDGGGYGFCFAGNYRFSSENMNPANNTVDEFKAYLQANPITVIGELKTPIETPLTETELNAYRQLYTNKGNTTILSEADMELDYYVNKPNAQAIGNIHSQVNKDYFKLQQAIISLGVTE